MNRRRRRLPAFKVREAVTGIPSPPTCSECGEPLPSEAAPGGRCADCEGRKREDV
ncbi:MAG: hypothetical protein Kow00128_19150 [Deltaproteobacteria bacterium]